MWSLILEMLTLNSQGQTSPLIMTIIINHCNSGASILRLVEIEMAVILRPVML